jgi:minimal PKS acyl carrier protein
MASRRFTNEDLERILHEAAGANDAAGSGTATADMHFEELGYDSLALLETASRIEREFGIKLEESSLTVALTPGELIDKVNEHLGAVSA